MTPSEKARKIAEKIVDLVCDIVYGETPTSLDDLDLSLLTKVLQEFGEQEFKRGYEEGKGCVKHNVYGRSCGGKHE